MSFKGRVFLVNRFLWPDQSATSVLASDLAFELVRAGYEVIGIASRQSYISGENVYPESDQSAGVRFQRLTTTAFGRGRSAGRAFDYASFLHDSVTILKRQLQPGDLVIAKTDPPMLGSFLRRTVARRGARLINWLQDLFPEVARAAGMPLSAGLPFSLLKRFRDRGIRAAAMNVVLGQGMARRVEALGGAVRVIPNWANDEQLRPVLPADNELLDQSGPADRFVIGYSGNFGRAHDYRTLAGSIEQLRGDQRVHFQFVGGGYGLGKLRSLVAEAGNVSYLPYQPRELLAQSLSVPDVHIVILNPEFEGLIVPSKVYGVLAVGRPVIFIGDPRGDVAKLLDRYKCGLSVAVGDSEGLSSRIRELSNAPERCREMGHNARLAASGELSRQNRITEWLSCVEAVMNEAVPPG